MISARRPASAIGAASAGAPLARRQIDREGKDRAAAGIVGERKFAAHQRDDAPGDREAEAGALEAARIGAVALLEILEDRRAAVGAERRGRCP